MRAYRTLTRSMLAAVVLGAGLAAAPTGVAMADQPWTHDQGYRHQDHHGHYDRGGRQRVGHDRGERRDRQAYGGGPDGWHHQRGDHHHAWHRRWRHDHRDAGRYRAYPPAIYAPPPAYYAPPALSFGINIPFGAGDGH